MVNEAYLRLVGQQGVEWQDRAHFFAVAAQVMRHLLGRLNCELSSNHSTVDAPLCQGSLLSREQYLVDLEQWGYRDARLSPEGCLTTHEIEHWTAAINRP